MKKIVTLDEFIINSQTTYSDSTGQLTRLLRDLGIAAKIINREVNLAGLVNIIGVANVENTSGDEVKKLDIFANERMMECLTMSGEVCGIASEELDDFVKVPKIQGKESHYVVIIDPLDGSSNIDVNVSVGKECIQQSGAVQAGVHRRRRQGASADHDSSGAHGLHRTLLRHPDRALCGRLPDLAGPRTGGGPHDHGQPARICSEDRLHAQEPRLSS